MAGWVSVWVVVEVVIVNVRTIGPLQNSRGPMVVGIPHIPILWGIPMPMGGKTVSLLATLRYALLGIRDWDSQLGAVH